MVIDVINLIFKVITGYGSNLFYLKKINKTVFVKQTNICTRSNYYFLISTDMTFFDLYDVKINFMIFIQKTLIIKNIFSNMNN